MKNLEWTYKKIAVLGYGVEGQSTVAYFLRHGAVVTVHDQKPLASLPTEIVASHQQQGVNFITEQAAFQGLSDYDLVMRTPTFSPHHPALANLLPSQISSQTQLFLQRWRNQTIGVSGTKGKGTTATLIHHLLRKSGRKTFLGGNIGVPLLEIIDKMDQDSLAVAELSSFQLWDATVSPHLAVLLMVVPEHLEQHRQLNDYLQAKQNLLQFQQPQDQAVVLVDYAYTQQIAQDMPGQQWQVSRHTVDRGVLTRGEALYDSAQPNIALAHLSDTVLRGSHNTQNLAAALLAVKLAGVNLNQAPQWLADYQPLPHRLELVDHINQISFYDDSIATTPEAAIAGIQSFTEPLIVILGGINQHAHWDRLAQALTHSNLRGVVLMGNEAPRIRQSLRNCGSKLPILYQPTTYDDAISWAITILAHEANGVILLSPGAKSFDQFQDYHDRGRQFTAAVKKFITNQSDSYHH